MEVLAGSLQAECLGQAHYTKCHQTLQKINETFISELCLLYYSQLGEFSCKFLSPNGSNDTRYILQLLLIQKFLIIQQPLRHCLQRERFVTQICLQIWSGGMPVLLASLRVTSFQPSQTAPRVTSCFVYIFEELTYLSTNIALRLE